MNYILICYFSWFNPTCLSRRLQCKLEQKESLGTKDWSEITDLLYAEYTRTTERQVPVNVLFWSIPSLESPSVPTRKIAALREQDLVGAPVSLN